MKSRLDNVGNVILDLKAFQQERQAQLANQVTTPPETFQEGQLVYLLAPSAATVRTNTKKYRADFVGPLVVNKKDTVKNHLVAQSLLISICMTHSPHITEEEAKTATPLPDIAPAAILQSIC